MNTPLTESTRPTKVVNLARILPLFSGQGSQLVLAPKRPTGVRLNRQAAAPSVALVPTRARRRAAAGLAKLPAQTLRVPTVQGTLSPVAGTSNLTPVGVAEMNLPPGMPRFVNAATLKRMLKAKSSELLLKRVGDQWEMVENSGRIDLLDDSVEFRLGAIQIFS